MTTDGKNDNKQSENDEIIQREILLERKFSIADAIGREGCNFIKGESPIPLLDQVVSEISVFIQNNINDTSRILMSVLQRTVKNDRVKIAENIERPFSYLHRLIKSYIDNPNLLYEITWEVDFTWGQIHNEKPYFQKPGEPPHPDDEYSHETVKEKLKDLLVKIENKI